MLQQRTIYFIRCDECGARRGDRASSPLQSFESEEDARNYAMMSGMFLMCDGAHLCKACHQHRQEQLASEMSKKCITKDCVNRVGEGTFVGDLCSPCHEFVAGGILNHSQACRNAIKANEKFLQSFAKIVEAGKFYFVNSELRIG
jgi:hypothetical protein